jgi:hypothetical protein
MENKTKPAHYIFMIVVMGESRIGGWWNLSSKNSPL